MYKGLLIGALITGMSVPYASTINETETPPDRVTVTVYKSPTCGCCDAWAEYMRAEGFEVVVHEDTDMASVKDSFSVPGTLSACHTAVVDGYVVEGHIAVDLVNRLLEERPAALGIAVPGMPSGSPGMDGIHEPHVVYAFDNSRVWRYAAR